MEQVYLSTDADFTIKYVNASGAAYDPPEVSFSIVRNVTDLALGPLTFSNGDVTKVSTGLYAYRFAVRSYMTPGIYAAKWEATLPTGGGYQMGLPAAGFSPVQGGGTSLYLDTNLEYALQDFQVSEVPPSSSTITEAPRVYGTIRESPAYQVMGQGLTDRVYLIGHVSGMELNEPHQVVNMQETVNMMGADSSSPLLRGMLEAYNAGCRDIWVVPSAPMTEYVPELDLRFTPRDEWGGDNFYERYKTRLDTTYEILREFDYPEIIVPLEAPFYDTQGVDFLTQLATHCNDCFEHTGKVRLGIIGTRIEETSPADITAMAEDPRAAGIILKEEATPGFSDGAKFVMVVLGEAIYSLPQMPTSHKAAVDVAAAAALAIRPWNKGATYAPLSQVVSLYGADLTESQKSLLTKAKLNPAIRKQRGKRGRPYNVVLASDNTIAADGSDFWSIVQMRLVSKVIDRVTSLGKRRIGHISYGSFKRDIEDFMVTLMARDFIRDYNLAIDIDVEDRERAIVEISIKPYFGIREIYFTVEVGPGA